MLALRNGFVYYSLCLVYLPPSAQFSHLLFLWSALRHLCRHHRHVLLRKFCVRICFSRRAVDAASNLRSVAVESAKVLQPADRSTVFAGCCGLVHRLGMSQLMSRAGGALPAIGLEYVPLVSTHVSELPDVAA